MKEERDRLLEEVNGYKMEKKKLAKALLEKKVAMKAMKLSLVDLERIVICLEMEKKLFMKTNEKLFSCSFQTTFSGGRITNKLLMSIPSVYVEVCFNAEKARNSEVLQPESL